MAVKELKRKSALLVKVLAYDHWHRYAKGLIKDILLNYNQRRPNRIRDIDREPLI